ncbi:MAG TPA: M2 family metallopeptidase [Candidatus Coprenecus stercoripullorum]|nr:M2 family metallopeptidase [Candidatus Coprenecus stercoripullorum]
MKKVFMVMAASILLAACSGTADEARLRQIIDSTVQRYAPLYRESSMAYWDGTLSGSPEAFGKYAELNLKIAGLFSDRETFAALKEIRDNGKVNDPLLARQLDVLYYAYLAKQADTALLSDIIRLETSLEQKYASFRAEFRGKRITDNQVESILRTSENNSELEDVWSAHKAIGPVVAPDIIELVKLRNSLAHSLGFDNYHTMSLILSGEEPEQIDAIMNEVDSLSRDSFAQVKADMDKAFAAKYSVAESDLMPWHYQGRFFQEAPRLYPVDLDKYYEGKDLEALTRDYYGSIGLDIEQMMAMSDLYPKEGKNQHAFCIDMDRNGDVRVLCNISDNEAWMGTMLHEFGHAAYAKGYDSNQELPYMLRESASIFTTEAVAMLFGRLSRNPQWMMRNLGISEEEANEIAGACYNTSRLQQLVQSRWMQVMYRFEKAMYADPDQDLNALWWSLVEKYQLLRCPKGRNEPDWATKIHVALYPCYYHNYQLGELFASQMHHYIVDNITESGDYRYDSYTGNPRVGKWMQDNIFSVGQKYRWEEMIERATGERLTARYWAEDFK